MTEATKHACMHAELINKPCYDSFRRTAKGLSRLYICIHSLPTWRRPSSLRNSGDESRRGDRWSQASDWLRAGPKDRMVRG